MTGDVPFEKCFNSNDSVLPVGNFTTKEANLPVLSYLFSLCGAGIGKIWRLEGLLVGRKKAIKMPSFSSGWL